MKPITKKLTRKISPDMARIIRRSFGFRAAIASAGGFHRSYVTRILNGVRPPSLRFLSAMAQAFERKARDTEFEIMRREVLRLGLGIGLSPESEESEKRA